MTHTQYRPLYLLITMWMMLTLLITGCSRVTDTPPLPTEPPTTVEPTQAETATPATPTAKLLLVDPAGTASPELSAYLSSYSAENGLAFETVTSTELAPQGEETKVVIFLAEPAGLSEFVASSPATQFILAGDVPTTALVNLSVIKASSVDLAFMAGFLTQMIAWDWRSLSPNRLINASRAAS